MDKTVVITGANSYLGSFVLREFLEKSHFEIIAVGSPRASAAFAENSRMRYFSADLAEPLSGQIKRSIARADWIFHFAWARGENFDHVNKKNLAMIENLAQVLEKKENFCLISSVAASPNAKSTYGRTKYQAMQKVNQIGGISLVLGLVTGNPAGGAFGLLLNFVKKFPVAFRLKSPPQVYPVSIESVSRAAQKIVGSKDLHGSYGLFGKPVSFNDFLESLEKEHPRFRLPLTLPTSLILSVASLIPFKIGGKLLTFLYKEPEYLKSHKSIPEFGYSQTIST